MSRKIRLLFGIPAALGIFFAVYAFLIEPRWIKVKSTSLGVLSPVSESPRIKIVHLTDFHYSPSVSIDYLKDAFERAAAEKPDLICLTGDYVSRKIPGPGYAAALKILSKAAPTFACPGNHDGGLWIRGRGYATTDTIRNLMASAGIKYLENDFVDTSIKGVSFAIGGVGDIWAGNCHPESIEEGFNASRAEVKILLTHNPDSKVWLKRLRWHMLLAGHTHGGQLELPFIGAPFAPVNDKTYLNGLYAYDDRYMYVSPGVGNLHGVRFNCRPEISVLNLVRKE